MIVETLSEVARLLERLWVLARGGAPLPDEPAAVDIDVRSARFRRLSDQLKPSTIGR